MILDDGICTVFRATDTAEPGGMPSVRYLPVFKSWYGVLNFETSPQWPTEGRKSNRIDKRIRILQGEVKEDDIVILEDLDSFPENPETVYKITRAWNGTADDGPDLISDLTLEVFKP